MTKAEKELQKEVDDISDTVVRIQTDLDIVKDMFHRFCRYCIHWNHTVGFKGECMVTKKNTFCNDICDKWSIMTTIKGQESRLQLIGKYTQLSYDEYVEYLNLASKDDLIKLAHTITHILGDKYGYLSQLEEYGQEEM